MNNQDNISTLKIISCAVFALLAFAGNSVLCRLALGQNSIDAASFTIIRLLSGSIVLAVILIMSNRGITGLSQGTSKGSWLASLMLFVYAIAFSFGYVSLDTGTGALILFGSVQLTMILFSIFSGNKLHYSEWGGLVIAFAGFVYLVMPTLATPSLTGFLLMTVAGIAWGIYTLRGKGSLSPISDTAYNFIRTTPLVLVIFLVSYPDASLSQTGVILAVVSGAITSGLGYALWYIALGGLSISQAAVIQLFVPIIAAIGGIIFGGENISSRLIISSVMVLGGIFVLMFGRYFFSRLASGTNNIR